MRDKEPILLAVHPLAHKGRHQLGNKWSIFVTALSDSLQRSGVPVNPDTNKLLLFTYSQPLNAITNLLEALSDAKQEIQWDDANGTLPVQAVFHLDKQDDHSDELRDPDSSLWNFLHHETLYVTRALKLQWDRLTGGKKLPSHSFEADDGGLFRLQFADTASVKRELLFPFRDLATVGTHKECFYCGRTNHLPAKCPSKILSMDVQGLPEVGYLSFTDLGTHYKEAFSQPGKLLSALTAGVKPSQVRKNPELQTYVAFFDLFRTYQLRFLHHIAFTFYIKWEEIGRIDKINIDSRNLNMGLDCLRVGQYEQARKLLGQDAVRRDGKEFYATVGQAFWALEQGREKDMGTMLERANNLADLEKDRVYIGLLLSRYYLLQGDLWKAEEAVNSVLAFYAECSEAQYNKILISLKSGFKEQAYNQLPSLVRHHKQFFLTALMDPMLIPIQGFVEDTLTAHLQDLVLKAKDKLDKASEECNELGSWLDENDEQLQPHLQTLATIQQQYDRQSYYDLIDVINRSTTLAASSQRLRREKLDELIDRLNDVTEKWNGYQAFWRSYPCKFLFASYVRALAASKNRLTEAHTLIEKQKSKAFRQAVALIEQTEGDLKNLKPLINRMVWVKEIYSGAVQFLKKLAITEAVLAGAGLALFAGLGYLSAGQGQEGLLNLLLDPWFQKKSMFVATLLVAPIVALGMTLWDMKDPGQ